MNRTEDDGYIFRKRDINLINGLIGCTLRSQESSLETREACVLNPALFVYLFHRIPSFFWCSEDLERILRCAKLPPKLLNEGWHGWWRSPPPIQLNQRELESREVKFQEPTSSNKTRCILCHHKTELNPNVNSYLERPRCSHSSVTAAPSDEKLRQRRGGPETRSSVAVLPSLSEKQTPGILRKDKHLYSAHNRRKHFFSKKH